MAAIRLVNAVNEVDFFQFLQGPIDRNQAHLFAPFAGFDKDIRRSECSVTLQNDLNDHLSGTGHPVTAVVEFLGPGVEKC